MKAGFRNTLDTILRNYGMLSGVHGTVWGVGDTLWKTIKGYGYPVEKGISASNYDYIILSEKKSNIENIQKSLTKIGNGCIIIFRMNKVGDAWQYERLPSSKITILYEYKYNKFLCVIVKGTKYEGNA